MRDTMENTLLNARATLPSYDRSKLVSRIVHLGFGAFHRAHQAVYADILAAEHGSDWGYTEVNLIFANTLSRPSTCACIACFTTPTTRAVQASADISATV